jgi:hypothetical protein
VPISWTVPYNVSNRFSWQCKNNSQKQDKNVTSLSQNWMERSSESSKKNLECLSFACFFKTHLSPFQEHTEFIENGQAIQSYTQTSWWLAMCSMESKSWQPFCLLAQGYFCLLAMLSRATFLVFENSALHVGQNFSLHLHLLQILWTFVHSFMGGTMYSVQTVHSRSHNRASSRAPDKSSISRICVTCFGMLLIGFWPQAWW